MKTPLTVEIAALFFAAFGIFSAMPPRVTKSEKRATIPEPKTFAAPEPAPTLIDRAFAASPTPADYDATGRDQFMISCSGTIYMTDQGTVKNVEYTFDPVAPTWVPQE
jgi:hypothetical protein